MINVKSEISSSEQKIIISINGGEIFFQVNINGGHHFNYGNEIKFNDDICICI